MPSNNRRTTLGPVSMNHRQSMGGGSSGATPIKGQPKQSRPPRGRQSMLPRVGRDNPPLPPSSSPGRSVSSTKTHNSRRRSVGGRQSMAPIKQDPRPVNDKSFQQKSANRLLDYLIKRGYNYNVTLKTLARPTQKDFANICTFLLQKLDPSFQSSPAVKFEDEVAMNFKAMGYPSTISKTSLVAAGSPHTWPTLLAALSWLVERLEILEVDEAEEYQNSLEQGIQGIQSIEDLRIRYDKVFYDFLGSSYNGYLQGDRALEDQSSIEFIEFVEEANNQVEREIERVTDLNSVLVEKINQLNEHSMSLPALEQKREDYANQLEQYYDMVRQMEEHRDALENKVLERTKELEETNALVAELSDKIKSLTRQIQNQELSVDDLRKMEEESDRVMAALDEAIVIREKKKQDAWEASARVEQLYEELSGFVTEYTDVLDNVSLVEPEVKDYRLDIRQTNAAATKQSDFLGVSINDQVLPFLVRCKDDSKDKVLALRQALKETLDCLESSKTAFSEATDRMEIACEKKAKMEEYMETEREQNEAALAVRVRENEELEQKIMSLRDPAAMEEQIARYQRKVSELEALQLKQQEQNHKRKKAVQDEITAALNAVSDHNAKVERLLAQTKQYKDQKIASLPKIVRPASLM